MELIGKIRKVGGSLMITIPKRTAEEKGFIPNETVRFGVNKLKKSGFGMFKELPEFTKKDRFDW